MPQIARKNYNTSFFHIMVQGIRKEYIFNEIEDMEFYCRLIYKYIEECNLTHQEIEDEVGINRVKVTKIINEK